MLFVASTLVALGALAVALLRPKGDRLPEVRFTRILRGGAEPADSPYFALPFSALPTGFGGRTLEAEFEVRAPPGSGIGLTNGAIGVEILSREGNWAPMPVSPSLLSPSIFETMWLRPLSTRMTCGTFRFSLPDSVPTCRFTIGFRLPTLKERCMATLFRTGVCRRFPGLSFWISMRMPATQKWLVSRSEVQVLPSHIQPEKVHDSREGSQTSLPNCGQRAFCNWLCKKRFVQLGLGIRLKGWNERERRGGVPVQPGTGR
jgi:hypothetical protein